MTKPPARAVQYRVLTMKLINYEPKGKIGYALLWLLGVPIPVLLGIFLIRGCN